MNCNLLFLELISENFKFKLVNTYFSVLCLIIYHLNVTRLIFRATVAAPTLLFVFDLKTCWLKKNIFF